MKRLLPLLLLPSLSFAAQIAVVWVPAVDVWSEFPTGPMSDDKRETQVLFGERVKIKETRGRWVRIEALEQDEFTHHQKWEGYPGWIEGSAIKRESVKPFTAIVVSTWTDLMQPETLPDIWLSLGSLIRPVGKTDALFVVTTPLGDRCVHMTNTRLASQVPKYGLRNDILKTAGLMIGTSYLWGGLTAGESPTQPLQADKSIKYGVDCSGLVHLSYRVNGVVVPRDSHEQWMKAEPVKRALLMPADLIFSAKADHPKKITHVALYAGNDQILEAPQTGMVVRQIAFKEKYGQLLSQVESGNTVGDRVIYFGRLVKD